MRRAINRHALEWIFQQILPCFRQPVQPRGMLCLLERFGVLVRTLLRGFDEAR